MNKKLPLLFTFLLLFLCSGIIAQQRVNHYITIHGTVYDISAKVPIEAVAVICSSGRGTITDSLGRYTLTVRTTDSIWFKLLNKETIKYPVDTISNPDAFNLMIHIRAVELPEVQVRNRNYRLDSLQNRKDYAKYFDFKKPTLRLSTNPTFNPGGLTVGLDLDEFINMFRFKRTRSLQSLQKRLVEQEQDKYIDHRYSKQFVRKITNLPSPELEKFMQLYRPNYELMSMFNDLELGYYIEKCFDQYKTFKKSHPSPASTPPPTPAPATPAPTKEEKQESPEYYPDR